ncbi:MYND finger [Pochonia chlamydosporia 170]|uniref:MYND finger n=1 Tax=Pochonia chlamydosporia 170 TaxID=1380566 RepID=A0A179FPU1_METCM|nr:MYND finger [Pochonia chlamydosporia 170]OAQ67612.1 MYND finger [Pochonia chlamydosporia 170]
MPLIMNVKVARLNGLASRACELCHRREGTLLRCSACQSIYYCGRDCQAKDRETHKTPCKLIKKARLLYEDEDHKLRNSPDDPFLPENIFENFAGRFWGILETRPYMRARYHLVDTILLSYGTAGGPVDSVKTSLDHLLDMIRLCRGDNLGVRQVVPALYIRLGRDQDAYDFMKWYGTAGKSRRYDWGNMDLPFLDVRGADALEPPTPWLRECLLDFSHTVAVMLIKVRVLLDPQSIHNTRIALTGAIPQEVIEMIREQLVGSIVASRQNILLGTTEETTQLAEVMKKQIKDLYTAIQKYNPYFWNLLINDPDAGVLRRPNGGYTHWSKEEALLVLGFNYAAWYETMGAMDMLRKLNKAA